MRTSTVPIANYLKGKSWISPANLVRASLAVGGIVLAQLVSPVMTAANSADPAALWGLLPIGLYALLAFSGMGTFAATVVALTCAIVLDVPTLHQTGELFLGSLSNQVTIIGLIIVLGAGAGGVLREVGVAQMIVGGVLRLVGQRGPRSMALGIMLACLVLVASLGTLAGALAIAAPLLIPVASRLGYTRISTATLMFIGGCAGLALAPFAGSNVAIMQAAEIGYGSYVLFGAGPLALLTLLVGILWTPYVQRRSSKLGDFYSPEEAAVTETPSRPAARRATGIFIVLLFVLVIFGIAADVGIVFPLIALPLLAVATGLGAGLSIRDWCSALGRGMWSMAGVFALFWMLAVLFLVIDRLEVFDTVLALLRPQLETSSPFFFSLIVGLIGWVGVPGATAAQVVMVDKVFGPLAGEMGVGSGAWVVVLLFSSKADTYGPFPNPNMVGVMGIAHSQNLRTMLLTGWILLVPAALMYILILFAATR